MNPLDIVSYFWVACILVYIAFAILVRKKPRQEIDQNVEWIGRAPRPIPCGQVYPGNMLEYLRAHDSARWRSYTAHRAETVTVAQRDSITHLEIFAN